MWIPQEGSGLWVHVCHCSPSTWPQSDRKWHGDSSLAKKTTKKQFGNLMYQRRYQQLNKYRIDEVGSLCVSNLGLIVVFASTQLVPQKIPVIFWWRTGVCFKLTCLYCMITRAQARKMANNDKATMPKFTGYSDVAPVVWLERYSMFANSKGWNPQQTLNNVGLYLADGHILGTGNCRQRQKNNLANYKLRSQTNICSMMDLHGPWEHNWQSV